MIVLKEVDDTPGTWWCNAKILLDFLDVFYIRFVLQVQYVRKYNNKIKMIH